MRKKEANRNSTSINRSDAGPVKIITSHDAQDPSSDHQVDTITVLTSHDVTDTHGVHQGRAKHGTHAFGKQKIVGDKPVVAAAAVMALSSIPTMRTLISASMGQPLNTFNPFSSFSWRLVAVAPTHILSVYTLSFMSYFTLFRMGNYDPTSRWNIALNVFIAVWSGLSASLLSASQKDLFKDLGSVGSYVPFAANILFYLPLMIIGTDFWLKFLTKARSYRRELINTLDSSEPRPAHYLEITEVVEPTAKEPWKVALTKASNSYIVSRYPGNNESEFVNSRSLRNTHLAAEVILGLGGAFLALSSTVLLGGMMANGLNTLPIPAIDYQSPFVISGGIALALPLTFFLTMAATLLCREIYSSISLAAASAKPEATGDRSYAKATLMAALTAIALFSNYMLVDGFKNLGESGVVAGYANYLGCSPTNMGGHFIINAAGYIAALTSQYMFQKAISYFIGSESLKDIWMINDPRLRTLLAYRPDATAITGSVPFAEYKSWLGQCFARCGKKTTPEDLKRPLLAEPGVVAGAVYSQTATAMLSATSPAGYGAVSQMDSPRGVGTRVPESAWNPDLQPQTRTLPGVGTVILQVGQATQIIAPPAENEDSLSGGSRAPQISMGAPTAGLHKLLSVMEPPVSPAQPVTAERRPPPKARTSPPQGQAATAGDPGFMMPPPPVSAESSAEWQAQGKPKVIVAADSPLKRAQLDASVAAAAEPTAAASSGEFTGVPNAPPM